jgi:acetyltransferase-like isoleucine patch superfamily enzyme
MTAISTLLERLSLERLLAPAAWLTRRRFRKAGKGSFVSPFIQGLGLDCVSLGDRSRIGRHTRLLALKRHGDQHFSPNVEIGDDVNIGFGCVISCINEVRIGNDALIADRAYIADSKHGHSSPGEGITRQPLEPGRIEIGDGAWIGYGAVIAGEISIGEHSIVAANSVVTHSVPPFTIVGGVPAKPLQRFDPSSNQWVRISDGPEL